MNKIFQILKAGLFIIGIVLLHISVKQTGIIPLIYLHTVFIAVVWLILYQATPRALWIALLPTFILELFSAALFGVNSLALMITFGLLSWLLIKIFTNHSLPMVGLAGLIGMITYRLLFLIFMEIAARNTGFEFTKELTVQWLLESLATTAGLLIFYVISIRFVKRLRPQYVRAH